MLKSKNLSDEQTAKSKSDLGDNESNSFLDRTVSASSDIKDSQQQPSVIRLRNMF